MTLVPALQSFLEKVGCEKKYWIAYSGGLDSTVLLYLCAELRQTLPLKLCAVHVNHGIHPDANQWAKQCEKICADLQIDFVQLNVQMNLKTGDSLEEVARKKRYAAIAEKFTAEDILLTAHHQNDQAETLLLQLMRGAGPKGLAAMPEIKSLGSGYQARPLLNFSRGDLQAYADAHQLQWIEDSANDNLQLARNFVRHEIIPSLKKYWPSATETLARSATNCAEAQKLLDEMAVDLYTKMQGTQPNTLSVQKLLTLSAAKQRLVIRTWIEALGFHLPDFKKMFSIQQNVLLAAWDKMPCVKWGEVELRRYRDDLYLQRPLFAHQHSQISWKLSEPLYLPEIGTLQAIPKMGMGIKVSQKELLVRFRHEAKLSKNRFQEWGIPPWLRDRVPLLYSDNELVAAVGFYANRDYKVEKDETGYEFFILI